MLNAIFPGKRRIIITIEYMFRPYIPYDYVFLRKNYSVALDTANFFAGTLLGVFFFNILK